MNTKVPKWMFIPKVPNTHVSILLNICLNLHMHTFPIFDRSIHISSELCILPAVISSFPYFPTNFLPQPLTTSITLCIDIHIFSLSLCSILQTSSMYHLIDQIFFFFFFMCTLFFLPYIQTGSSCCYCS